jgi:hypothetical protein
VGEAALPEAREGAPAVAGHRVPDADHLIPVLDHQDPPVGGEVRLILSGWRVVDAAAHLAGRRLPDVQYPLGVHQGRLLAVGRQGRAEKHVRPTGEALRGVPGGAAWLAGERVPGASAATNAARDQVLAVRGEPHRQDIIRESPHWPGRLARFGIPQADDAVRRLGQNLPVGGVGQQRGIGVLVPVAQLPPRGHREEPGLVPPAAYGVAADQGLAVRGEAQGPDSTLSSHYGPADLGPGGRIPDVEHHGRHDGGEPLAVRGEGKR